LILYRGIFLRKEKSPPGDNRCRIGAYLQMVPTASTSGRIATNAAKMFSRVRQGRVRATDRPTIDGPGLRQLTLPRPVRLSDRGLPPELPPACEARFSYGKLICVANGKTTAKSTKAARTITFSFVLLREVRV
jgi:hypothetical protein